MLVFKLETSKTEPYSRLVLAGPLNEEAGLALHKVQGRLGSSVEIDLGGVTQVNSLGAASWWQFLRAVQGKSKLRYQRCSAAFQAQILMMPGLVAGVAVESVLVEARCPGCQASRQFEATSATWKDRGHQACPTCAEILDPHADDELGDALGWAE